MLIIDNYNVLSYVILSPKCIKMEGKGGTLTKSQNITDLIKLMYHEVCVQDSWAHDKKDLPYRFHDKISFICRVNQTRFKEFHGSL